MYMEKIIILGAGGHAKVVADILLRQGAHIIGFLDDDADTCGKRLLGIEVLGAISFLSDLQNVILVQGIGANRVRKRLADSLNPGIRWKQVIHPSAIIAPSAKIGIGVVVAAGAIINPDAVIGDHVIINTGASIDHDCTVEAYAHIAPGARLAGGVKVGSGTLVGIGASVIPYRTIGEWATIGAGATVIRDIPAQVTAVGIPAIWSTSETSLSAS